MNIWLGDTDIVSFCTSIFLLQSQPTVTEFHFQGVLCIDVTSNFGPYVLSVYHIYIYIYTRHSTEQLRVSVTVWFHLREISLKSEIDR